MRIVLVMDSPSLPTGYASTCRLTARMLSSMGHEILATSFNGGHQSNDVVEWFGIKIIPNTALKRSADAIYGDAEMIREIEGRFHPDIYLFHNDSYRCRYLLDLPRSILDKSLFWLPFEGNQRDELGVQIFSKCAATRFVTEHAMDVHRESLDGKDIGHLYHAVDLDHMTPCPDKAAAKAAKKLGVESKFVVLRVDRHQPRKHWDLTIKAFAKFARDKDDVFLLAKCNPRDITMWNEESKEGMDLEAMASEMGVGDKTYFDDYFFDESSMAKCFYHAADVFLTTTSGEGFGLPPCEAMACGLPVIYPDTPVLPEVIGDGGIKYGLSGREWYAPMNVWHNIPDVDQAAEKLQWAYDDWKSGGSELSKMGDRGRQIAVERYAPERIYAQWNDLMHDVSERSRLVSVITVLYNLKGDEQINGEDGIDKYRETMEKYVSHPYEWIIVDNGSPKREVTRTWMERAAASNPRIKTIYSDVNLGFAGGCNMGISRSKGKHVVLSNPDSEALDHRKMNLPGDFLAMLSAKAESDPAIGIVGMEINERDDVMPGSRFPYFCNVLLTRRCLDAIKLKDGKWLDEKFWPAYYEDCEAVQRAMSKGFKIIDENVPFWHKSGGTNKFAIEGGKNGPHVASLLADLDKIESEGLLDMDFDRKRGELKADGMQGLIKGNIAYLNSLWGPSARSGVKVVWNTHIGAAVGFSQIAEGLIPELHEMGFDVYVNDWSDGANVENSLIRHLIEKTRKAKESGDDLSDAVNIVCWLMETFLNVDADFKIGISLCESTKVRESYLQACNQMDGILTFSEFCRGVQRDSGFTSPISVIPPGVNDIYINLHERPRGGKFTFLSVGVSQGRKDDRRLARAFAEAFPKGAERPPECEPGFPLKCDDVELVIKSNNFGDLDWVKADGLDKAANIRTIFTGWTDKAERKDFTTKEMYDLYASADALVHPSHGEGIGYPLCCIPESKIMTTNGFEEIRNIHEGDYVFTHRGRKRKVIKVMRRTFDGKLKKIRALLNNEAVMVTPEHPLLVVRKRYCHSNDKRHALECANWIPANDIKKGDLLVMPMSKIDDDNDEVIDLTKLLDEWKYMSYNKTHIWSKYSNRQGQGVTALKMAKRSGVSKRQIYRVMENRIGVAEQTKQKVIATMQELGYENNSDIRCNRFIKMDYNTGLLLGYYASEGSLNKGNISFTFHRKETGFHAQVSKLMLETFGIEESMPHKKPEWDNTHEMIFCGMPAACLFKRMVGKGAIRKVLSDEIMNATSEFKHGLLRGMFNGDGSTTDGITSTFPSFSTSSVRMAYQIWSLLIEQGIAAFIRKAHRTNNKNPEFTIGYTIYDEHDEILGIVAPSKNRSRSFYRKSVMGDSFVLCQVLKIENEPYCGEVFNMEIDEDKSYCINGYAVHNCEAAATGAPVIFTNWSSPAEYFDESNSYPISLSPYGDALTKAYPGAPGDNGVWANAHVGHLKFLMYHVIRNREEALGKGRRAHEMIKKKYTWKESARHLAPLIMEWDAMRRAKTERSGFDPVTFVRPTLDPVRKGDRVLIDIVSRDRHPYLSCLLTSLLGQTFREWDVVIQCDDTDESMPSDPLIISLLARGGHEGHGWRMIRSHRQGPHVAHDRTLQMARDDPNYKYKLICRIDDDIILEPDFLERLYQQFLYDDECKLAAAGGTYLDPRRPRVDQMAPNGFESDINYSGKIEPNVPWPYVCLYPPGTPPRDVEHLYSSFMFRVEVATAIGGYCSLFSQIGHREESDLTYRFHLSGYRQIIVPTANGWHFAASSGGIRSGDIVDKQNLAESDHKIYLRRLSKWRSRIEEARAARERTALEETALDPKTARNHEDPVTGETTGKIVAIINGGNDISKLRRAVERMAPLADELYLTCPNEAARTELSSMDKVRMVAVTGSEMAMLTQAVLSEGDHEYVMSVSDVMSFQGDPRTLLSPDYDDYVFETYKTYRRGESRRAGGIVFIGSKEDENDPLIGPEVMNKCLITRRARGGGTNASRILYADMVVLEDDRLTPRDGKSEMGNRLLAAGKMRTSPWRKTCVYQFPEGRLSSPRYAEVNPDDASRMVSILIPTAGRRVLLKKCMDSIYSHTTTPFEIIVVDNGSEDGTREYLDKESAIRPNLSVMRQQVNLGYQRAMNMAISRAKGGYLLLFNDDAWIEGRMPDGRDWIRTLMDELDSRENIGIVGPHAGVSPALGRPVLYFWCVMMRRSLYDEVGPLDDITFRNYGGDDDYCERIRSTGREIKACDGMDGILRHLMTCVPEDVKHPEIMESRAKLLEKYGHEDAIATRSI